MRTRTAGKTGTQFKSAKRLMGSRKQEEQNTPAIHMAKKRVYAVSFGSKP